MKIVTTVEEAAREIRKAMGVGPNEGIQVIMPQFDRPASLGPVKAPPNTPEKWSALLTMTHEQLRDAGLYPWDDALMLFPVDWYSAIPDRFPLVGIGGAAFLFAPNQTDSDCRFGFLAYGVKAATK